MNLQYAIRGSFILLFAGLLSCSSSTDASSALSQAEMEEITLAITQAMEDALASQGYGPPPAGAPLQLNGFPKSNFQIFEQIAVTANCKDGGTIGVSGSITGTISDPTPTSVGGTGAIQVGLTGTYSSCQYGDVVLSGAPSLSYASTMSFLSGNVSWPVSASIGGAFTATRNGVATNCPVILTALAYANGSAHVSGQVCGRGYDKTT